jgi:hypothetical protein
VAADGDVGVRFRSGGETSECTAAETTGPLAELGGPARAGDATRLGPARATMKNALGMIRVKCTTTPSKALLRAPTTLVAAASNAVRPRALTVK